MWDAGTTEPMATLDWHLTRAGETTLVELLVTTERRQRVAIASGLEPVWPPRCRGRPETGWNESRYEGTVAPDDRLILGFASPAEPVHPPARIVSESAVTEETEAAVPSPDELVQTLGRAEPPRAAVRPESARGDQSSETDEPEDGHSPQPATENGRQSGTSPASNPSATSERIIEPPGGESPTGVGQSAHESSLDEPAPGPYLDAVRQRLGDAARLSEADTVIEARASVEAAGGMEAVRELETRLTADRQQLQAMEETRAELAEQLSRIDIPVRALERLV